MAATLQKCWNDEIGREARRKFVKQADDLEAAAYTLRRLAKVYDRLADDMESAQRTLRSALDYAQRHELEIDESGRVQPKNPKVGKPGVMDPHVAHVRPIVEEALRKATKADTEAATLIRTIQGLAEVDDPRLARTALARNGGNPLAIALRLHATRGDLHPINVGPAQIEAVKRAAAETGVSRKLLLAILWQEQQWYQNFDSDLQGPIPFIGRVLNWALRETGVRPDKSLGITHMKLETAREVMNAYPREFTSADGKFLGDLDDSQLAKYIEENPNESVRLSAYYLARLGENPYGAGSDKQLFLLYAAESEQVREANAEYGDSSEERRNAIARRAKNWDELQAPLDDALAWDALTEAERKDALTRLRGHLGQNFKPDPIFSSDDRQPRPSPGPAPEPPK